MKSPRLLLALFLGLSVALPAQEPEPQSASGAAVAAPRTPQELEQLLAPIALYPDALIAIILPATTAPTDIVLAARHLRDNPGDRSQIEHRAWDESVKSLTNYPEVLQWLDDNLQWTQQVGEAFVRQSADVMQAIQRLRAKAQAAGTLTNTPQQQVIAEAQVIRIVPTQPDVIYVPHYEPDIVFVDHPAYYHYPRPFLTFGIGVPVGAWLAFDCDWRRNTIWVGNRHRHWAPHDWRRPVVPIAPAYRSTPIAEVRPWRPSPHTVRPSYHASNRFRSEIARPSPLASSFTRHDGNRSAGFADRDRRRDNNAPTVVPALPRPAGAELRNDFVGPRSPRSTVSAPTTVAPLNVPATTPPNLQPLPQSRRADRSNSPRENDGGERTRSFRGRSEPSAAPAVSATPPVATPSPAREWRGQPSGNPTPRSFSRNQSPLAPPPAASMPGVNNVSRSSPPATVAPAPAPAAPTTSAPASTSSGGESRGHRGGGGNGGRRDYQDRRER